MLLNIFKDMVIKFNNKMNHKLGDKIKSIINEDLEKILQEIAKTYKLDFKELKLKYLPRNIFRNNNIDTDENMKDTDKIDIDKIDTEKTDGDKIDSDKIDSNKIDTEKTDGDKPVVKEKSKRGRKRRVKEEFIETEEYPYNGTTYLVDDKNFVYTYDLNDPKCIGEKLIDGTVKFFKSS